MTNMFLMFEKVWVKIGDMNFDVHATDIYGWAPNAYLIHNFD